MTWLSAPHTPDLFAMATKDPSWSYMANYGHLNRNTDSSGLPIPFPLVRRPDGKLRFELPDGVIFKEVFAHSEGLSLEKRGGDEDKGFAQKVGVGPGSSLDPAAIAGKPQEALSLVATDEKSPSEATLNGLATPSSIEAETVKEREVSQQPEDTASNASKDAPAIDLNALRAKVLASKKVPAASKAVGKAQPAPKSSSPPKQQKTQQNQQQQQPKKKKPRLRQAQSSGDTNRSNPIPTYEESRASEAIIQKKNQRKAQQAQMKQQPQMGYAFPLQPNEWQDPGLQQPFYDPFPPIPIPPFPHPNPELLFLGSGGPGYPAPPPFMGQEPFYPPSDGYESLGMPNGNGPMPFGGRFQPNEPGYPPPMPAQMWSPSAPPPNGMQMVVSVCRMRKRANVDFLSAI